MLIERDGVIAAIEISVTTPIEHEHENLRKCLSQGYPRVAIILAKSKIAQTSYRQRLSEAVADTDRARVSFLTPEEVPDFINSLVAPPQPSERTVKGYRVKGGITRTSSEEDRARQAAVTRLIAKSLSQHKES